MAKTLLTYEQLKAYVTNVVTASKMSNGSFIETRDNTVGLLDKIGKIVMLDTDYLTDKLYIFDGEYLSFGKTIEEWQEDLLPIEDYDPTGANALAPSDPSYRPPFYSYTLGKKKCKTTIRYNDIERAVHFEEQFVNIISIKYKRLEDSMAQYRYAVKRQMLAKFIELAHGEMTNTNTFATSTAYDNGAVVRSASSGQNIKYGIVVKAIASSNSKNWATLVSEGSIVELHLESEIAKPVDATSGENFIVQVKKDVEVARDSNEGNSLNGNSLGATEGLVLILKQGVMPEIEVKTEAGAFHLEKVALPTEVIVVKDFGNADADYFAILMDRRGMRLHNTYNATREDNNGDGDFLNVTRHTEDTAYLSRNVFFHAYKNVSA